MKNSLLSKIVFGIFTMLWCIVVFTEYLRYNPEYIKSFENFGYLDLLALFILISAVLTWGLSRIKEKPIKFINGLSLFGGLLVVEMITVSLMYSKLPNISLGAPKLFTHLGHLIGITTTTFLIYLVARTTGSILTFIFPLKINKADLSIIQVAMGIMAMTFLLFFLGLFGLLKNWIVIPLFILILAADFRKTFQIIKKALFQPLNETKDLNFIGVFSFLFLGVFLILNFVQILRPFPAGTDSINLYVNLPMLISDYGALVNGHQPYNWSLFMSLGLIVFGRIDMVLTLSFLGGFLSLIALYRLSRKWLDINYSALCLLLFFSVPMINFLAFMDMKIDMGLLFIMLCILLVLYNWIIPTTTTTRVEKKVKTAPSKKKKGKIQKQKKHRSIEHPPQYLLKSKTFFKTYIPSVLKENRLLVLMGLLSGFAFGIKLTTLFFFFALMTIVWYIIGGNWGFFSASFLTFAAAFILKLDGNSQLRSFHESVHLFQWILLLIGIVSAGYLFLKQKETMMKLTRQSLILSVFFLLPMIPWFGKNLSETKKVSVESLINGKKKTPEFNFQNLENK